MTNQIKPLPNVKIPKNKVGRKKKIQMDDPIIKTKLARAVSVGKLKSRTENISSIRTMLKTKEICEAMEDIINMSSVSTGVKTFLKAVFLEQLSKKKAIQKAFGKDLGYQEEILSRGLMENPSVKEFVAILKQFYVQIAPIAMLKEVDIMLDPMTDKKVALQASMDIQDRAMPTAQKGNLAQPVTVIINAPNGNQMTQINTNE